MDEVLHDQVKAAAGMHLQELARKTWISESELIEMAQAEAQQPALLTKISSRPKPKPRLRLVSCEGV